VVILEEISIANPKKEEPAKWAKIQMPANTPVGPCDVYRCRDQDREANRLNLREDR
jgi:hypothetical protein